MGGHPNTPQGEGDLYCSHIMQVGQSLVANKNELMAEMATRAPEEDLEKLQEAVRKDNHAIKKWRTLATCTTLPMGYQLTLMAARQYTNVLEGHLASSKELLKGMKMHPDKHAKRAVTDMEQ